MNAISWIELSSSSLYNNIKSYASFLPQDTAISVVIKGNAYGHGLLEVARLHESNHLVKKLCVATSEEALKLIEAGIQKPIFILSCVMPFHLDEMIIHGIECVVHDESDVERMHEAAQRLQKIMKIQLKVDTGLSRFGVLPSEVQPIVEKISQLSNMELVGIFSHFSCADIPSIVHEQEKRFEPVLQNKIPAHMGSSLGSLQVQNVYDYARIGLGQYGYCVDMNHPISSTLRPVLSLKSTIIFLKNVEAGRYIGYGTVYKAEKKMRVAIVGIGYYDGIPFIFAQRGFVLIRGKRIKIIAVNMNALIVDVTDMETCSLYDTVTLLGKDGVESLSIYDWQSWHMCNPRTFLVGLQSLLPRYIVE